MYFHHCDLIGASVSEPPSSDANGNYIYIYILLLCVVRRAAYPKLIQFNARNVYKIRIVRCSTMESYSNSSARVPESSGNGEDRLQRRRERERARRASETAEQREERLRVRRARDRADVPLRLPKRETPDCKYAITDVRV